MNINEIEKIIPKEKILQNVQMKKYTSFKIGGEAEVLIKISTLEELTKIIKYIKQKNITATETARTADRPRHFPAWPSW